LPKKHRFDFGAVLKQIGPLHDKGLGNGTCGEHVTHAMKWLIFVKNTAISTCLLQQKLKTGSICTHETHCICHTKTLTSCQILHKNCHFGYYFGIFL